MKKFILLVAIFTLFGCKSNVIEVGDFEEKRQSLHERHNYEICETQPERCINGVPW